MSVEDQIFERSKKCEVFSNSLRSYIALLIAAKEEVSWSELKSALEEKVGGVNPNTLSFHIGKLMEADFLKKLNIQGQPRYRITEYGASEVKMMIGEDLIKKIKEGS